MAEYNNTGVVRTLVGNWQEERGLKAATGTARCQLTGNVGCGDRNIAALTHEPTFERVVQHTEQQRPKDWTPHSTQSYQPPAARSDLLSYPKVAACGPRQAQELERMRQQAAMQEPAQVEQASYETSYQAEYQAKTMEGLQIGHKVMRPDGSPAARDPVFLQETGIVPNAGRLMTAGQQQDSNATAGTGPILAKVPSLGYVRAPGGAGSNSMLRSSGLTSSSIDPAVPITMYTEAASKASYTGTFYGTATVGKGLMNRNDQFTKLMGDVNKQQQLL